jgi:dihydrofolate reductase
MRKLTMGFACSLDHFITGPDGALDWLLWTKDAAAITAAYWKTIDTVLLGRKTYAVARAQSKGKKRLYAGMRSVVFSRTLAPSCDEDVEIVASDAVAFVRELKALPGKDLCLMGGAELGRSLLEGGVVDELGLNVHPVVLGRGTPAFLPMDRRIGLELLECRPLEEGCVYLTYRVRSSA